MEGGLELREGERREEGGRREVGGASMAKARLFLLAPRVKAEGG
jgi:hypothetical protein